VCPYIGDTGCLLDPSDRPNICLSYLCDDVIRHIEAGEYEAPENYLEVNCII